MDYVTFIQSIITENQYRKIAEIGVYKAQLTKKILKDSRCSKLILEYYAVDPWKEFTDFKHTRMGRKTQADWDLLYQRVCRWMIRHPNFWALKLTSKQASELFPNKYLDLVFIDASHLYKDTINDINYWYPKIRQGGTISGHDYGTGMKRGHKVTEAVISVFGKGNFEVEETCGVWFTQI